MKTRLFAILLSTLLFACGEDTGSGPGPGSSAIADNHQNCAHTTNSDTNGTVGLLACREKTYPTIRIGTQTWMAEDLNVGSFIVSGTMSANASNNSLLEKGCYGDTLANCTARGGVYQWAEAMALPALCNDSLCIDSIKKPQHQGICPNGWHIPSNQEFQQLASYLGGSSYAGATMKRNGTGNRAWDTVMNNDGNSSGFSAIPVGYFHDGVGWANGDTHILFWSTGEASSKVGVYHSLGYQRTNLYEGTHYKRFAMSVRCLMD